jgi:hypothetical protein
VYDDHCDCWKKILDKTHDPYANLCADGFGSNRAVMASAPVPLSASFSSHQLLDRTALFPSLMFCLLCWKGFNRPAIEGVGVSHRAKLWKLTARVFGAPVQLVWPVGRQRTQQQEHPYALLVLGVLSGDHVLERTGVLSSLCLQQQSTYCCQKITMTSQ